MTGTRRFRRARRCSRKRRSAAVSHVTAASGVTVVSLAVTFAAGIATARVLGPVDRGRLAALLGWSGLAHIVGSFGVPSAIVFFSSHRDSANALFITQRVPRLVLLHTLATLVLAVGLLWFIGRRVAVPVPTALLFSVWASMGTLTASVICLYQGVGQFRRVHLLRAGSQILPAACVVLLWASSASFSLQAVAGVYAAVLLATGGLAAAMLRSSVRSIVRSAHVSEQERPADLTVIYRYAVASLFSLAGQTLNTRVDQLVLSLRGPTATLGTYAVAYPFAMVATPLSTGLAIVGFRQVAAAEPAQQRRVVLRLVRLSGLVGVAVMCLVLISAGLVIPIVFGESFRHAAPIARVLAVGGAAASVTHVLGTCLRAAGKPAVVGKAELVGALVTGVGAFFVARLGGVAVAIAASCGFLAALLLQTWAVRSVFEQEKGAGAV